MSSTNKEISLEVRAVIAAAVYVTMGADARIASVEPHHQVVTTDVGPRVSAWSLEGRREIQGGHRVR
jgi:hypothetical protein